ncbi:MAG: DsbA family protein [Nanoarchaeota archaeon]
MEEEKIETRSKFEPTLRPGPVEQKKPLEQKPLQHPQQSSDLFWKVTTIILIVILTVVAFKGEIFGQRDSKNDQVAAPSPTAAAAGEVAGEAAVVDVKQLMETDRVLGDADAPVTLVEFSDYQCPYCGRFYSETLLQIKSKFIDQGKVKFVFRDFPLSFHPEALPAAIAANCAGEQGKYWEYHDKLFTNQQSLGVDNYKQWAKDLGLDIGKWESCLNDPKQKEEIAKDFRDGQNAGVQGTPASFVNGKLISGAQPFAVFEQLINAELNG